MCKSVIKLLANIAMQFTGHRRHHYALLWIDNIIKAHISHIDERLIWIVGSMWIWSWYMPINIYYEYEYMWHFSINNRLLVM